MMAVSTNHAQGSLRRDQQDLLRILGYSYQRNGQPARAAVLWSALHALSPRDSFVTRSLALALLRSARPDAALTLLDGLLDEGDACALTHLLRSQALVTIGRLPEASRSMRFYVAARAAEQSSREN